MQDGAEWGAAVLRVRRVAYAGAIVMIGAVGCSASAQTTPTTTPSASVSTSPAVATPTASRKPILVRLSPTKVTAGENSKVWILANCPVPSGGPAHTGTATSKAFLSGVPLTTAPTGATATPTPTGRVTAANPWVRGEAQVSSTVKRGSYVVDVKCDGTNDTGKATLQVVRATADAADDDTKPTKAPRAGGGGTFGKDLDEGSGMPVGGVLAGVAVLAAAGLLIKRRIRG
ncbi:hypothetical protein AB0F17_23630 [Nonomuraea sp. NPDC026600]|uniref:hypothetical protein n=1 Tax=Nonomuraea sp. NPDC026600 TaxID=3155363 RepID=UPI0033E0639F